MRNVTNDYLSQVQGSGRQFGVSVKVYGNGAEPESLWLGDIISIDILRSCSDQLQIGACMSDMLTLETKATTLFNGRLKKVEVFYRCTAPVLDWIQLGTFYVDEAVTRNGVTAVKAYDMMSRLDKRVSWVDTSKATAPTFPCKMQAILNYLCARAGVTTDFTCEDITVEKAPDGYTAQELISYIAASHGRNARFSPSEVLKFPAYEEVEKTIQHGRCYSLDIAGGSGYTVKGILLQRGGDDKIYIDGTASEYDETADGIVTAYDPFATVGITEYVWNKLGGLNYSALSLEMPAENILEPGDVFTVEDADGTQKKAIVMEQELSLTCTGGFVEKISCTAESKAQNRSTENRQEETEKQVTQLGPAYTTHIVTNAQSLSFDSIERGLLSVDFKVDSTDSDVLFSGNQLCSISSGGTVGFVYKVDGALQDFKPEQLLAAGKHIIPHIFPMALTAGKHNFAVYMLSADGRGFTDVGALRGALSGCISGMKTNAPPNENLVFYYTGLPAGELTLPAGIISGSSKKYVDWGDGSAVEESVANAAVTHSYADGGDYIITVKTDSVTFGGLYVRIASEGFESYLTRIYFPDNAGTINFPSQKLPNLEALTFGNSATSVSWSFGSLCNVTSLLLPDTVQSLYLYNFNNTRVVSFVIPQSVTSWAADSYVLSVPATLRTLEKYGSLRLSLSGASALETLKIGGNAVRTYTCQSAAKLKSVVFTAPSKVAEVTAYAFKDCTSLPEIVLPNSVTTIGSEAFRNCTSLKAVNIPPGVTKIEDSTFRNCSSLPEITLPNVTQIGSYAFQSCKSLASARLSESLTAIGSYAFYNCVDLVSVNIPPGVTKIEDNTFQNCSSLPEINLPNVTQINDSAFKSCSNLGSVDLSEGLTRIGKYAFQDCVALNAITFPATLTVVDTWAFKGCSAEFSPGTAARIVSVGNGAFADSGITEFTAYPETVLGDFSFQNCTELRKLEIHEGVTRIPRYCFDNTTSLAELKLPAGLLTIGEYAFRGSSALTVLPDGLLTIGSYAFQNNEMSGIVIPPSVTNIGSFAFNGSSLVALSVRGNPDIGTAAFAGCKSLSGADISSLTVIPSQCFSGCSNLVAIDLNANTRIGERAFAGCGFTSLDLLSYVAPLTAPTTYGGTYDIGKEAFLNCKSLASVDDYKYLWDLYLKTVEGTLGSDGKWSYTTSYERVAEGIYNRMGATEGGVFDGTALKSKSDFPKSEIPADEKTATYSRTYSIVSSFTQNPPEN